MKKRLMMALACLLLSLGTVLAQNQIKGSVVASDDGQPVVGATIKVVGTNNGTVTDANGQFSLSVRNGAALEVSYVGMTTKRVNAAPNMKIALDSDHQMLDEVMVVAYGTQKKSAFTGSAAIIGSDEIGKVQVTNAVDALKGKAAGVQIYNASGQPGFESTIRIRGVNSLSASNAPLIVLDGSPFSGSFNDINPIDVESMTVLKDAASTALYGARGGNGVILITTKSAKKGNDAVITVDAKWGANSKGSLNYDRITDPAAYYEMWYHGLNNYAKNRLHYDDAAAYQWANANLIDRSGNSYGLGYNVYTVPEGQTMIGQNGKLNPNATLGRFVQNNGETYWIQPDNFDDEIYHTSLRQEYTVNATGSTDKSTFYASVNYLSTDGLTDGSDYERFTGRLNASYQLKKWAKLTGNMSYSHFVQNYLSGEGDSSVGNVFALHNIAPIYPVFIRDANKKIMYNENVGINVYDYGDQTYLPFTRPYLGQSNPLSDMKVDTQETEGNTFNGVGIADIYLPFGFTFTSINNVYLNEQRYTNVTNPYFGQYATNNGTVFKEHDRTWSYNFQQRLTWHKLFGLHDVEAMVAHEYYRDRGYALNYQMHNMFSQENKELAGAVVGDTGTSYMTDYNTESWLGRVMYNFAERYFGSASFVHQASSRFHPDHRWGSFWSVGGGWLINKEKFFTADWVDELKLKASYGENGNDGIGNFLYTNRYEIVNSNDAVSLTPSSIKGNEEITWEKNGKFNVGVDFSLWQGRLYGSIEYYSNSTKDMLTTFPYPPTLGYTSAYANVGNMLNQGVEIDLHGDIIRTKDFTWNVYANLTTNHNEITKLAEERKTQEVNGHWGYASGGFFYTEGESRYTYYTYKYAGVDPATGDALYYKDIYETDKDNNVVKDANGNKIVKETTTTTTASDATQYLCGDVLPDVYGGFGTSLNWKGLDFSVDFQYQIGGQIYDEEYRSLMSGNTGYGMHTDLLNAWTVNNPNTNIPRFEQGNSYMASTSDRWLTSASYLSLANITLGYTLPKSVTSRIGVQKLRIYAVGDNLYTWSKRKGLDPRQTIAGSLGQGVSGALYYSSIRSISGGISVTF